MAAVKAADDEVPVLLAGGGLVGLSTAMFLAQHGVASLAVERLRGGSPVPRAAFFHMRTLEGLKTRNRGRWPRTGRDRRDNPQRSLIEAIGAVLMKN
jgi:2-polyprenyl-6-methoxyphenol hydroxylase-like FAD-dependent oxidoreductase